MKGSTSLPFTIAFMLLDSAESSDQRMLDGSEHDAHRFDSVVHYLMR